MSYGSGDATWYVCKMTLVMDTVIHTGLGWGETILFKQTSAGHKILLLLVICPFLVAYTGIYIRSSFGVLVDQPPVWGPIY